MREQVWWCPRCEECSINTGNQAWCNRTSACDGVVMLVIGYIDSKGEVVDVEIKQPKVVL